MLQVQKMQWHLLCCRWMVAKDEEIILEIVCACLLCAVGACYSWEELWKSHHVLKADLVSFAAQCTHPSGRQRGSAVCHSVSTLQHTEAHSCHHHSQKVSTPCQCSGRVAATPAPVCAGIPGCLLHALAYMDARGTNPLLTLQLGRCTDSAPAHQGCIWPGGCCRAHGTAGSVQGWVWGGTWCSALAGQAAHQAGKTNTLSLGAFLISVKMKVTTAIFFQIDLLCLCSGRGHIAVAWDNSEPSVISKFGME